jgi:tetratricopeptide (TPR) repeat protein
MKIYPLVVAIVLVSTALCIAQPTFGSDVSELEFAEKLIGDGMPEVAREELERFLEGEPPSDLQQRAMILLGDISSSRSEFEKSRRLYFGAYEADPRGEKACAALFKAGECLMRLKRYRDAASTFEQVAARFPECPHLCEALRNVGVSFFRRGDFEQATKEFEKGSVLCREERWSAELLYWLGVSLTRTNAERAVTAFESLRKEHPGTKAAFKGSVRLAELLRERGNLRTALNVLDDALSYEVDKGLLGGAFFMRARLLESIGREQDAATAYSNCFRLSPDSSLAEECNLRAQAGFLAAGEYRQANSLAEKLLSGGLSERARRTSLFTRARAARSRRALRDAVGLLAEMECAVSADSLCLEAAVEEGEIREELGDAEGAAAAYLRAVTLPGDDETHTAALMRLGELSTGAAGTGGRPDERARGRERARAFYTLLVDLYPESETVEAASWELALLHEEDGDFSKASAAYRRLTRDFPLGSRADEALERAEILETLFPPRVGPEELRRLRLLVVSAANGSVAGDKLLEQAAVLFESRLHSFGEAQALLGQALRSSPPDRKHIVLLRLSDLHMLLSRKYSFEGKSKEAAQQKAAGLRYLRDLVAQYGRTELADDAALALVREELEGLDPPGKHRTAAARYTEFLQDYPNSDRFEEALLGRAQALMRLSTKPEDQFHAEAQASYEKLIVEFPRSPLVADARYGKGHLLRKAGLLDAAEREFETVLSGYPESSPVADAAYELGECKLARRDLDRAISLYAFAFESGRTRTLRERALSRKGDCYLVKGELNNAVREYEYILKYHPTGPFADDLLAREAEAYLRRGMLEEASGPESRLSKQFPKSLLLRRVLVRKAEAEVRAREFVKATSTYLRLYSEFPETRADSTLMLALGRSSFESEDFSSSLEAYERTLNLAQSTDTRREAAGRLVLSLARMGQDARAQRRLEWYQKSFPADSTLAAEIAMERGLSLYEASEWNAAYTRLSEALGGLRGEARKKALVTMGLCKLRQKEFARASQHFGEAVKLASTDSELDFTAHFKLGTSLYAQAKYLQASRDYLSASRLASDASSRCDALYNSALCLEKAEEWSEAASLYEEIRDGCKGKQSQGAAFKSGYCELNAGRHRKAVELLRRALEVADGEEKPEVQYWIGEAHGSMGEFERAASEFLKVPFLYGEGSLWAVTARYKAGMAFERAGDVESAIKQYRILLEKEGERSQWGSLARERLLELSK